MATGKLKAAEAALAKAKQEDIDDIKKQDAKAESKRLSEAAQADKAAEDANAQALSTLDGDTGDSERKTVIVQRRYSDLKHKIFVSTHIKKDGELVLVPFRVPVDVEVDLPVEIIAALKERGIAKFVDGKQIIAKEFLVEVV